MSDIGTARTIEVEDHSEGVAFENNRLNIDPATTAVVTIDMHRGHLDMTHATLPARPDEAERVLEGAGDFLKFAREHGLKIFHIVLTMREREWDRAINPRASGGWTLSTKTFQTEAQKQGVKHNLEGSIQTELMPELDFQEEDYLVTNKKTLSCFLGTELDLTLRREGIDTLILMGINTNTCVLNAAFESFNLTYKTVVMSDCVSSMYGLDLHEFALENVARCLGWVLTNEQAKQKVLDAEEWRRHNAAE